MAAVELARAYRVHPSTVPFHRSQATVKALCGPVGSGKSTAACFEMWLAMREALEPLHWIVIRESYRQLHDSTRRTWEHWFSGCTRYIRSDEKALVTVENVDGKVLVHEVDFRHARRPEEASNFLSTEYAGAWLEEVVPAYQMDEGVIGAGLAKEIFDIVQMRLRQPGAHRPHILLTFNPPHKYHWVYKEFFARKVAELEELDYALFRSPAFENAKYLRKGYYEQLLKTLDPDLARRFVLGEPVTMYPGVRVFPEAYESKHFREYVEVVQGVQLVIGFDFGLTPCAVIGQVLPNGRLQVYREIQMFNAGVERLADALAGVLNEIDTVTGGPRFRNNTWRCWGDPAGAQRAQTDEKTCFDILSARGFSVQPGAVDWESRRQSVKQRFERFIDGEPGILIDSQGCQTLSEGILGGYRYPHSTDGRLMARPIKNQFSHTNDALQYLVTGEFNVALGLANHRESEKQARRARAFDPFTPNPTHAKGSWMVH